MQIELGQMTMKYNENAFSGANIFYNEHRRSLEPSIEAKMKKTQFCRRHFQIHHREINCLNFD